MIQGKMRKALIGALGGVLLIGAVGVGAALAADPPAQATPQSSFIAKLAKNLGIEEPKLTAAIQQSHNEVLDDAVKSGQLTQAQADQMKQHLQDGTCGATAGMMGGSGAQHMNGQGMMGSGANHMNGQGMMGGFAPSNPKTPAATPGS